MKTIATHTGQGYEVVFKQVDAWSAQYGTESTYCIHVCSPNGEWSRHGGHNNFYRNADKARQEFYTLADKLCSYPARPAFEVTA